MTDKKINLKLINFALLAFIAGILYLTFPFWGELLNRIVSILIPFVVSFAIAYALYPFLLKMERKGIPKLLGIGILTIVILGGIGAIFYVLIPILYDQIVSLVNISIDTVKNLSNEYNIDLSNIQDKITDIGSLTTQFGSDISKLGYNIISTSLSFLIMSVVCFIISLYFLSEMTKIRTWFKKILTRAKDSKRFKYVKELDNQITNYFVGLEAFMLIQFFEYTLAYLIIGHPYFLLMGILASVTTVIPYFGGIVANIIAVLTAALISPKLLIMSIIVCIILPIFDGYVLSPRVYAKSNDMHPLIIIFSVFAGGILGGVIGIIIALPLAIILICTYRFYEKEIINKIKDRD